MLNDDYKTNSNFDLSTRYTFYARYFQMCNYCVPQLYADYFYVIKMVLKFSLEFWNIRSSTLYMFID